MLLSCILNEAASDVKILKLASQIVDKVFNDDMLQAIKYTLEANPSYVKQFHEPYKPVSTEITEPVHLIYEVYFCHQKDRPSLRGSTLYTDPPVIRFFVADMAGRAYYTITPDANEFLYNTNKHREDEFDEAAFKKCWFNLFVHETAHALDKLMRHSDIFKRHTRKTLQQTKEGKYTDETLEANARIPQIMYSYCEDLFNMKEKYDFSLSKCTEQLDFNYVLRKFKPMISYDLKELSDDMRKRTIKRLYDAYTRIKDVVKQHEVEIKKPQDIYKYFEDMEEYKKENNSVFNILGNKAKIVTTKNEIYYLEMMPEPAEAAFSNYDFEYKVKSNNADDGAIMKFPVNKRQDKNKLVFDVEFENGKQLRNAFMQCKKIEKL